MLIMYNSNLVALFCAIIGGTATIVGALIGKTRKAGLIAIFIGGFFLICAACVLVVGQWNEPNPGMTPEPTSVIATTPSTQVPTLVPTVPPTTPSPEPHEMLSKYPDPPSDDLIDIYGPGLHYPEKTEYLSECRTMYVDAPKGYSIYAYSSHRKDKKQIYEVYDGEEVTVLAVNKNNGFSCVIIESMQKAAWVNSNHLGSSPN